MKKLLVMGLIAFLSDCAGKNRKIPNADLMPAPFDFVLADHSGNPLVTSPAQNIQLWYDSGGLKSYIPDLKIKPIISSGRFGFYATSVFAPLKSSDNISKHFFLQLDNGQTDTIYLDVVRLSQPVEGEYNRYNEVRFNGVIVTPDKSHQPALFVFKRSRASAQR